MVVGYFLLVRKIVEPMRLLPFKERLFLFGEFALSKSHYLYNNALQTMVVNRKLREKAREKVL